MQRLLEHVRVLGQSEPGTREGVVAFVLAASGAVVLARWSGLGLLNALALLSLWAAGVAVSVALPRRASGIRVAALAGAAALAAWLLWPRAGFITGATTGLLQASAIIAGLTAILLQFFSVFAAQMAAKAGARHLLPLIPLARFLALAQAGTALVLFAFLHLNLNWLGQADRILRGSAVLLVTETGLLVLATFFQPTRWRQAQGALPDSLLLGLCFGQATPLRRAAEALRRNFGVRLADTWLARLLRQWTAALVLLFGLGLWASTGITSVPVHAQGVLSLGGRYQPQPLPPGLHLHAPWPVGRVAIVSTAALHEFSLGFERDLGGPVLWTEPHFSGEQNLLLGGGEELLTVNVPVSYRISDAAAYLRRTADAESALRALGSRQLLTVAGQYSAIGLMTTDRAAVADNLRGNLQAACDRLGLGLTITHVGLQDVHPPVSVAPAFQDVISAEEEHDTLVDSARSYAALALGDAQAEAIRVRTEADARAHERLAQAKAESSRFLAALPAYLDHPEVLSRRLRLEALEEGLSRVRHLTILSRSAPGARTFVLGYPTTPSPTPPAPDPSAQP